jgi:hypothetical protein
MKRLASIAVLLTLVTACGNDAAEGGERRGTMEAVYADFRRTPTATYKVEFKAEGLGVTHVTAYWKRGKARVDTTGPARTTRHYATGQGLIECLKKAEGFDCAYKNSPQGYSFRLHAGPDWSKQLAISRSAGKRPEQRKIAGQTVDCWSYDRAGGSLEQETCVNEHGAVLSYRGGKEGEPYKAVAVSYSTKVSDAEVRPPKARRVPHNFFPTSIVTTTTSTTPPPP